MSGNEFSPGIECAKSVEPRVRHFSSFEEAHRHLLEIGFYGRGGVLLTDHDETLRPSFDGGLTTHFDRIPPEVESALKYAVESGTRVAIVTNQVTEGHQIAQVSSKIWGYTPALKFYREQGIPVFGAKTKGGVNTIREAFSYMRNTASGNYYKETPESVAEVVAWIKSLPREQRKRMVWIGNNQRDEDFGKRLYQGLRDALPQEEIPDFEIYRLPEFRSKSGRVLEHLPMERRPKRS